MRFYAYRVTFLFNDRSERGKLRFTGPQRAWFLHQILTQAFEDMGPGESRDAAKLTAHGRMTGYMEFVATEDALFCHFEPELKETLPEEIRRYVFATQVVIDDVSDEYGLVLIVGERWREAVVTAGAVEQETRSLGPAAGYVWVPAASRPEVLEQLSSSGAREATEDDLERMRIDNAVPRWGREMDVKTFPQETGIDSWAVHYDKGCYVGQEAMAKIHFRGKVNRRLAKLEGDRLRRGEDIIDEGVKVGIVTSAQGDKGLALVRYTVEPGAEVEVGASRAKVVS
ncbi:MAG: hypothetical protein QOH90_734 [Actinomycetota bacterium]|nr:hypothetical protein [Actinomycetota bacterium]